MSEIKVLTKAVFEPLENGDLEIVRLQAEISSFVSIRLTKKETNILYKFLNQIKGE